MWFFQALVKVGRSEDPWIGGFWAGDFFLLLVSFPILVSFPSLSNPSGNNEWFRRRILELGWMSGKGRALIWLVVGLLEKDSVEVTCLSNEVYLLGNSLSLR